MTRKVAVIGLDGMSWHILHKLFQWKVMPSLEELAKKSLKGILKSTIPPESGPAWTSLATGVNPGKHGIFGFTQPTKNYDGIKIMSSRDVKYLRIHEMVAVQNLKSVCINQILTYPIKTIPGSYVITDWLSPEIKCSPEIEQYAENYRGPTLVKSSPLLKKDWDAEYADLSSRVETVNTLLQKVDWNLFWAVYSEPDHLFHRYYDLVINRNKKIMRLFGKIDETFNVVKDVADLIIVVSDHGFEKFHYGVYLNSFLEELGLVKRVERQTIKDLACQRQVDSPKIQFHLPEIFYQFISRLPSYVELMLSKIYKQLLRVDIRAKLSTYVNPKLSTAFAHGFGIYVNEKGIIDFLASRLKNTSFIGGVWKKEELYRGKQLKPMPELVIIPNFDKGFAFRGNVIAPKSVVRRDFSSHHPDGIILIHKKGLHPSWSNEIKIYDIVPTILNFLKLEIPKDIDGKVIPLPKNS
jgi:predicted AlkP superfamily phosphohydrolase/phosphomutase